MKEFMNFRRRAAVSLCCILLTVLVLAGMHTSASYASGGGGDGSGTGGGSSVALRMAYSNPANGASGVSTTPVIACRFTHNVAEASISAANLTHLSLKKEGGAAVGIQTYVADVQIEFDKRQYLYAKPVSPLEPGTKYVLTVSAGVKAKNGMTSGSAQTVTFTTAGQAPQAEKPQPQPAQSAAAAEPAANAQGSGSAPAGGAEAAQPVQPKNEALAVDSKADANDADTQKPEQDKNDEDAQDETEQDAAEADASDGDTQDDAVDKADDNDGDSGMKEKTDSGNNMAAIIVLICIAVLAAGGGAAAVWLQKRKK